MKTKVLFQEEQKQNQKWIWFLVMILQITFLIIGVQEWVFNQPVGEKPIPWFVYVPIFIVLGFLLFILFKSKLVTTITKEGVKFIYHPFHKKEKVINKEDIKNMYVRLYKPLSEYGGWGMRTAFNGSNGKAYNVAGKVGIQLELKDGSKILLGTQKGQEAKQAILQLQSNK